MAVLTWLTQLAAPRRPQQAENEEAEEERADADEAHLAAAAAIVVASRPSPDVPLPQRPLRSPILLLKAALAIAYTGGDGQEESIAMRTRAGSTLARVEDTEQLGEELRGLLCLPTSRGFGRRRAAAEVAILEDVINCLPGGGAYDAQKLYAIELRARGETAKVNFPVSDAASDGDPSSSDESKAARSLLQKFELLQLQVDELFSQTLLLVSGDQFAGVVAEVRQHGRPSVTFPLA